MRPHIIFRYTGLVFLLNSGFLFLAAIISLIYSDEGFMPLLYTAVISAFVGAFPLIYVPPTKEISNNEGLIIVVSSWLLSCLIGAVPFVLYGGEFSFINAWFESVSGYTTTGASILTNIEVIPNSILFWRATTHWIGGIGIIIFVISVLPSMGSAGMILYKTELSAYATEKFKMRTKQATQVILKVYIGLTILEIIALMLAGMNLFDAVIHTFATVATGGFSSKNSSIAYYDSVAIETVINIFMFLAGIHLGLLFSVIMGNFKNLITSTVIRYYFFIVLSAIILSTLDLYFQDATTFFDGLRKSTFQVISIITTTGFITDDFSLWPSLSMFIIIFLGFQGAVAGSTAGGMKVDRIIIMFKEIARRIKLLQHPSAVINIKINQLKVPDNLVMASLVYILLYLIIILIGTLILSILGIDLLTGLSAVVSSMGNVGPGLGLVGPVNNYHDINNLGKFVLSIIMLLGRLEIFGFLIFLLRSTWK